MDASQLKILKQEMKAQNIPYFVGLFGLCIDSKYYDQLKDRYWFTTIGNKIFPHKK